MTSRRCVCGSSAKFPICDGSHGDGWVCAASRVVGTCVLAGGHLASLGERLAHREGGVVAHAVDGPVTADRLVVLTDGTDLGQVRAELGRIQARDRRVIVVDAPLAVLSEGFDGFALHRAAPEDPLQLWRAVKAALDGDALQPTPLPTAFLSHAVVDEPVLQPAVDHLRRFAGAELFLCADSIASGTPWRDSIEHALRASDRFVLVGSAASFTSTFCAFEVGLATALGKPCHTVVLDGTSPPPFVAHLQATDLVRHRARRPWLSFEEALIDTLFVALATA